MTIYTPKTTDHKDETDGPAPEVVTEPLVSNMQNEKKEKAQIPALSPTLITITARRRRSNFANVCVLLTALLVLAIGVIGGIYLYKHLAHRTFRGWCGVRYYDMQQKYHGQPSRYEGHFEEHVELDKENGYYEKVEVPEFDECRKAVVVHDFRTNLTVIVDEDRAHCFVKPLNRTNVRPPQDFFDLLVKVKTGYYLPDATVIHQRYRVIQKPVNNLQPFGYYIWQMCKNYDTYWLERMPNEPYTMAKRSVRELYTYAEGSAGADLVKDHIFFDEENSA